MLISVQDISYENTGLASLDSSQLKAISGNTFTITISGVVKDVYSYNPVGSVTTGSITVP